MSIDETETACQETKLEQTTNIKRRNENEMSRDETKRHVKRRNNDETSRDEAKTNVNRLN